MMSKITPNKVGSVQLEFTACEFCHYHEEEDCGKNNLEAPERWFDYDDQNNCIVCCGFEPRKKRR